MKKQLAVLIAAIGFSYSAMACDCSARIGVTEAREEARQSVTPELYAWTLKEEAGPENVKKWQQFNREFRKEQLQIQREKEEKERCNAELSRKLEEQKQAGCCVDAYYDTPAKWEKKPKKASTRFFLEYAP